MAWNGNQSPMKRPHGVTWQRKGNGAFEQSQANKRNPRGWDPRFGARPQEERVCHRLSRHGYLQDPWCTAERSRKTCAIITYPLQVLNLREIMCNRESAGLKNVLSIPLYKEDCYLRRLHQLSRLWPVARTVWTSGTK